MRDTLITVFLLAFAVAGCSAARSGGAPAGNPRDSDEPAIQMPSLVSADNAPGSPAGAEPTTAPSAGDADTPYKLKDWVDICQDESGLWQEGIEGYQPVSYGGTNSYSWKLGEFQAELYQKTVQGDGGQLVTENSYTTSWTLPETITPGTTIRIPVTGSGKHVSTYNGSTTEETWDASSAAKYGDTYLSLYMGAAKSEGGAGYDISMASDSDNLGYVEMDVHRGLPSYKVLEIRVAYICDDIIMGKIYYYER